MRAQCNQASFGFHVHGRREVVARFDGGRISSDGGGLLLREAERVTRTIAQFAACFTDHRDPELVEFGAYMADGLRAAAESIKMIGARKNVRQANVQPQYDYYTYGTNYGYSYRSGYVGSYGTVAVPNTTAYAKDLARISTEERASGATDARHYQGVSDSIFRFAPFVYESTDLKRVHGVDERLPVQGYADAVRFYARLITNACE